MLKCGGEKMRVGTNPTPTPSSQEPMPELSRKPIKKAKYIATFYMKNGIAHECYSDHNPQEFLTITDGYFFFDQTHEMKVGIKISEISAVTYTENNHAE